LGRFTNETNTNYFTLRNSEKYLFTQSGNTDFWADYFTIPSYNRGRFIYQGITASAFVDDIDFCPAGAFWWSGAEDFSYNVSSAYDDTYLYFTINVRDDIVVRPFINIENGEALEVWIDPSINYTNRSDRFAAGKDGNITYKKMPQNDLYKIEIFAGDFINKEPTMKLIKISGNDINSIEMNNNVVANLTDIGYNIIFKIPFSSLGKTAPALDTIFEWGMTVRVIDVDNEFRPERRTILQSSLFEEGNPSSFGSILFVPANKWYGESNNIYSNKIIQALEEFGF